MPGPGGTPVVVHATLDLGHGRSQVGEVNPACHLVAPPPGEDDCCSLGVYVPDADDVVARAVDAGAPGREPVTTFVSGDRFAGIRDPFGVRWSVMAWGGNLSDERSAEPVAAWAASMPGG